MKRFVLMALLLSVGWTMTPVLAQQSNGCNPQEIERDREQLKVYLKKLEDCISEEAMHSDCSPEFHQIKDAFDQFRKDFPRYQIEIKTLPKGKPCDDNQIMQNYPPY